MKRKAGYLMKRTKLTLGILIMLTVLSGAGIAQDINTNAILIVGRLQVDNGNFKYSRQENNYRVNQTGFAADMGVQSVTNTSTNVLNISNVETPHYCWFRNLTNANVFVTMTMKLEPGDIAIVPVSSTNMTIYTTNSWSRLEYWVNAK